MITAEQLHPEFLVDREGCPTSVLLPFSEYETLLEDLEDLAVIAERRDETTLSHEHVLKELRNDGLLDG